MHESPGTIERQTHKKGLGDRHLRKLYKAVRLLDEMAILACSACVDLNPIRAAVAETLETSDCTSAQRRVQTLRSDVANAHRSGTQSGSAPMPEDKQAAATQPTSQHRPDRMLAPLSTDDLRDAFGAVPEQLTVSCE